MARQFCILYDITELYQLLGRDIVQILYRLYNHHTTDTGLTVHDLIAFWFEDQLYRTSAVLLARKPNPTRLGRPALCNALRHELHPAFAGLLFRIVRIPPFLKVREARRIEVTGDTLAIVFDQDKKLTQELLNVHYFTHRASKPKALRRNRDLQ